VPPVVPPGALGRWERYFPWLYWIAAAGLAPWIVYLYFTQKPRAHAHQVHLLAGGLILAMIAGILATAWTYWRNSGLSPLTASFAATVTFISAWFRVLTEAGGSRWEGSVPAFLVLVAAIVVLCVLVMISEATSRSQPERRADWLPIALIGAACLLVPSLVVVLVAVPRHEIAHHLVIAWTGLDVFELLALTFTGFALHRRSALAVIPAAITGALLLCDAWINVVPASASARAEGIELCFAEVPMAAFSFWIAVRVARRSR
jgi:hypothetical protein